MINCYVQQMNELITVNHQNKISIFFKTWIPNIYDKALPGKTVHFWQEDPHYIWHCLLAKHMKVHVSYALNSYVFTRVMLFNVLKVLKKNYDSRLEIFLNFNKMCKCTFCRMKQNPGVYILHKNWVSILSI